jgi:branched-chain amino acid transport system permease protein
VGGLGNIPAAMVGGCLIGLSEALGAAYLSANLRDI